MFRWDIAQVLFIIGVLQPSILIQLIAIVVGKVLSVIFITRGMHLYHKKNQSDNNFYW